MVGRPKAMKNPEIPSTEQVEALKAWAALYGRNWKSALRSAWMDVNYHGFADSHLLQQVRNTFGPSWLVRFVICKGVGSVVADAVRAKEYESSIEEKKFEYGDGSARLAAPMATLTSCAASSKPTSAISAGKRPISTSTRN